MADGKMLIDGQKDTSAMDFKGALNIPIPGGSGKTYGDMLVEVAAEELSSSIR